MKKLLKILIPSLLSSQLLIGLPKTFQEITYGQAIPINQECILATDIGGTNSNFGIFTVYDGIPNMVLSIHIKSKKVENLANTLNEILDYLKTTYGITIKNASISCAGLISANRETCYNTNVSININEIIEKTGLAYAVLSNDFEIIGFGIDLIDQKNIVQIKNGKKIKKATRLILGAGTGFGKCTLIWNNTLNRYISVPSEFGHSDFSPQSQIEYALTEFIKKREHRTHSVRWQDVLSGSGISRMYEFFCQKNNETCPNLSPAEIFKNKHISKTCMDTYQLFTKLYAKCAKDLALDTIATGGIYIAGGIAAKNIDMFALPLFVDTFTTSYFHSKLLQNIPIYIITDYKISLYGAAAFMLLEQAH